MYHWASALEVLVGVGLPLEPPLYHHVVFTFSFISDFGTGTMMMSKSTMCNRQYMEKLKENKSQ